MLGDLCFGLIPPLALSMTKRLLNQSAQVTLAQAVEATKTFDNVKLAQYMHSHEFKTVVGPITFGKDGEWAVTHPPGGFGLSVVPTASVGADEIVGWSLTDRGIADRLRLPEGHPGRALVERDALRLTDPDRLHLPHRVPDERTHLHRLVHHLCQRLAVMTHRSRRQRPGERRLPLGDDPVVEIDHRKLTPRLLDPPYPILGLRPRRRPHRLTSSHRSSRA